MSGAVVVPKVGRRKGSHEPCRSRVPTYGWVCECQSGMWGVAMNIEWIWEFLIRWKYNAEAENQLIFGQVLPMMCVIS